MAWKSIESALVAALAELVSQWCSELDVIKAKSKPDMTLKTYIRSRQLLEVFRSFTGE
jgi:inorganic triphosphatase YgiF